MSNGKLIEGLVVDERADHIITVRPDITAVVEMQTVIIGVPSVVEPVACALFAEGRASEQPVNNMLVWVGGRVIHECLNLLWCRQYPSKVKRYAANHGRLIGFRRGLQTFFFQFCRTEAVDCIPLL